MVVEGRVMEERERGKDGLWKKGVLWEKRRGRAPLRACKLHRTTMLESSLVDALRKSKRASGESDDCEWWLGEWLGSGGWRVVVGGWWLEGGWWK